MDPVASVLIPMGTSFLTALVTKGKSGGPLQTLDDCWELVFGNFHLFVEKKRALHEQHLNDYKNKIAREFIKIPSENLHEPALNIIGPALEASKFFIESETIREMFAKVIAASMDNRKSDQVHSCYIEIIKQLSPLDAQNIVVLKVKQQPVAEYGFANEQSTYSPMQTNIFLSNINNQDIELNAISLSNLHRLGLIDIIYDNFIPDSSMYSAFSETALYKYYSDLVVRIKALPSNQDNIPTEIREIVIDYAENSLDKLDIKKGLVRLTPLGKSFSAICC